MERDFWLERWDRQQIAFHQHEVNPALQAHWASLDVPAGAPVFVPLCGKSRDMLWLRRQGHAILGVELSRIAVRDFFAENGMSPEVSQHGHLERWSAEGFTLLCGDFFELTARELAGVAGVYDRASLIALPTQMRERYARRMMELLPPGTRTLLVTIDYPEGEMQGPPFSVSEREVRRLYAGASAVTLLAESDTLAENPNLRERGLTRLVEQAYRIER